MTAAELIVFNQHLQKAIEHAPNDELKLRLAAIKLYANQTFVQQQEAHAED